MPQRSTPFQAFVYFVNKHLAGEARVTESAQLIDRVTGSQREVDVYIETAVAGNPVTVSIEVTESSRPVDVGWVERMWGKHQSLLTGTLVLVSEAGFSRSAIEKARFLGVEAVRPEEISEEISDELGMRIVGRLKSLFLKVVAITIERVGLRLFDPGESEIKVMATTAPDLAVFTENGTEVVGLNDYVLARLQLGTEMERIVADLNVDDVTEDAERTMTAAIYDPRARINGVDQRLWIQRSDGVLERVETIGVGARVVFQVAEFPLENRRLGGTAVAYGQAPVGERLSLLVITEQPDGSGKASIRLGENESAFEWTG